MRALELALKFFLGVGALEFGELVLDFAVGGLQAQRFRFFEQDVIVDQLVQNIQLERQRFILGRLGRIGVQLRAVVFVDFRARDGRAVDNSPHPFIRHHRLLASGQHRQGRGQHEPSPPTYPHDVSLCRVRVSLLR